MDGDTGTAQTHPGIHKDNDRTLRHQQRVGWVDRSGNFNQQEVVMSEPRTNSLREASFSRTAGDRAKSLREIDNQFSRIDNALYRRYINYEMDEDDFFRRRQAIRDAYDRYQVNIMRTQIPGWKRGNAYPRSFGLYDQRIPRSVYARNNRR